MSVGELDEVETVEGAREGGRGGASLAPTPVADGLRGSDGPSALDAGCGLRASWPDLAGRLVGTGGGADDETVDETDAVREMGGDGLIAGVDDPDAGEFPPNLDRSEATLDGGPSSFVGALGMGPASFSCRAGSVPVGLGVATAGLLDLEGGGGGGAFLTGSSGSGGLGWEIEGALTRVGLGGDCLGVGGKSAWVGVVAVKDGDIFGGGDGLDWVKPSEVDDFDDPGATWVGWRGGDG